MHRANCSIVNYGSITGQSGTIAFGHTQASITNYGFIASILFADTSDFLDTHLGTMGGLMLSGGQGFDIADFSGLLDGVVGNLAT